MSGLIAIPFEELLAQLAALPPDDHRHALENALRESDADDLLTAWMIVGEDDGRPMDYRQFLAMGFVNGRFPPSYFLVPGATDAESQSQLDDIVAALTAEKPKPFSLQATQRLLGDDPKTIVYLAFGHKRDDGTPVLALWHHPGIDLRRAVHLAIAAIGMDAKRRTRRGS
jgi:hypothetical protein